MVRGSVEETLNALPACGGADSPAVVYTYAPVSRRRAVRRLCSVQEGARDRITLAFCWSRLRREFFKIAERGDAPIATKPSRALARSTPSRRTCAAQVPISAVPALRLLTVIVTRSVGTHHAR